MDYFGDDLLTLPSKGDLLISEPYLPDPNFERTVVLLCEHDENGSFGFVLNKKAKAVLNDLIDEVGEEFDADIFVGGPVQRNTLHFLHRGHGAFSGDIKIKEDIHWGVDFDSLLQQINTKQIKEEDITDKSSSDVEPKGKKEEKKRSPKKRATNKELENTDTEDKKDNPKQKRKGWWAV